MHPSRNRFRRFSEAFFHRHQPLASRASHSPLALTHTPRQVIHIDQIELTEPASSILQHHSREPTPPIRISKPQREYKTSYNVIVFKRYLDVVALIW
jgi:hypothetical protein